MRQIIRSIGVCAILLIAGGAHRLLAQFVNDSACTYERCALNIAPRLSGLDVVRGAAEVRVASLGFFVPGRVRQAFVGNPLAESHALRAEHRRAVAAALTVGGIALGCGGMVALKRHGLTSPIRFALLGLAGATVAASVPVHFAADGELSRAVWSYNQAFVR